MTPKVFEDERGLFFESYHQQKFEEAIGKVNFVQDNISISIKGVLRGLHFQVGSNAQAKLVSVLKGRVQDVVVDLRKNSKTFGQYHSVILDDIMKQQLFIPRGFAHGFLALSDKVIFSYKCDNYYNQSSESGIIFNDSTLKVDWEIPEDQLILSEKDQLLPIFEDFEQ